MLPRPLGVRDSAFSMKRANERVEVCFANATPTEHPLHGRTNLGAHLIAMGSVQSTSGCA